MAVAYTTAYCTVVSTAAIFTLAHPSTVKYGREGPREARARYAYGVRVGAVAKKCPYV